MNQTQLAQLVDRYAGPLALYAAQWAVAPEDAVQEAFILLVKHNPPAVVPWLYRTVKHRALSQRRADNRRSRREALAVCLRQADSVGFDAVELADLLELLPAEQRETVVAHLWGGLTFAEIAELTGSSVGTAHRRYQLGLSQLRLTLEDPAPDRKDSCQPANPN